MTPPGRDWQTGRSRYSRYSQGGMPSWIFPCELGDQTRKSYRRSSTYMHHLSNATERGGLMIRLPTEIVASLLAATTVKAAATKPEWLVAWCASQLALNATMRGCELKSLRLR